MGERRPRRTPAPPPPIETELKYAVRDPAALRAWLDGDGLTGIPGLTATASGIREVEDLYIDTTRGALARHGFGARLRRHGTKVTLTVKSAGRDEPAGSDQPGDRALRRRIELEGAATMHLDPESWPASPARELVDELRGGARLRPRFVVRQARHEWQLSDADGKALLTFDAVEVHVGRRRAGTFTTLEVESADGGEALLRRVAAALEGTGLVEPEPRSKDELAQGIVTAFQAGPLPPLVPPKVPKSPGIRPEDPLAEAGRKVLRLHLARMLAYEAGTRSGVDPEDLHKMRVATRRMRAAWRTFGDAFKPGIRRRYVRSIRGIADALGAVRDLDVIIEGVEAVLPALGPEDRDGLEVYLADRRAARASARSALLVLLDSRDYRDIVETALDFTETPGAGGIRPAGQGPALVRDTAASRIFLAWEQVRAHDAAIAWADPVALHALRIDLKRLRYTIEAFREVLPARAERIVAEIVRVQDHLGLLNDADVAAAQARLWLIEHAAGIDPAVAGAVGRYLRGREAEVTRLRRRFPVLWRRIMAPSFRRAIAAAVAEI